MSSSNHHTVRKYTSQVRNENMPAKNYAPCSIAQAQDIRHRLAGIANFGKELHRPVGIATFYAWRDNRDSSWWADVPSYVKE